MVRALTASLSFEFVFMRLVSNFLSKEKLRINMGNMDEQNRKQYDGFVTDGGAGGVAGTVALPPLFSNVMLKQLRFKTLVKFSREAYKMLYFYL